MDSWKRSLNLILSGNRNGVQFKFLCLVSKEMFEWKIDPNKFQLMFGCTLEKSKLTSIPTAVDVRSSGGGGHRRFAPMICQLVGSNVRPLLQPPPLSPSRSSEDFPTPLLGPSKHCPTAAVVVCLTRRPRLSRGQGETSFFLGRPLSSSTSNCHG